MATFSLNGDIVDGASSFDNVKKEIDSVSADISRFSTSYVNDEDCAWGIDITSLKTDVKTNVDTCAKRVENTKNAIRIVGENHINLQKSLKFEMPYVAGFTSSKSSQSPTSNTYQATNGGGYSPSGGSSTGMASSAASGLDALNSNGEDDLSDIEDFSEDAEEIGDEEENSEENENENEGENEEENIDCELTFEDTSLIGIDTSELEEGTDSYNLFVKYPGLIQYDENGYARIHPEALPEDAYSKDVDIFGKENRYVVACSSSTGKVGEVLRFTQDNGDIIECVIGYNDDTEGEETTLKFVIDPESVTNGTFNNVTENIISDNESYEHIENKQFTEVENKSIIQGNFI